MKMSLNYESQLEQKALIDFLFVKFKNMFKIGNFKEVVNNILSEQYNTAIEKVEKQLDLNINLVPKSNDIKFLQRYVDENINSASDDMANQLRQEIQRGILNDDTKTDLIKRVKTLFKNKKYQTRLKTIIRTETLRANNMGTLESAKQAESTGVKLEKWLDVIMDKKTSNICKKEHAKYGTPEQSIKLDEEFVVKVDNKTIKSLNAPFHVNCRSVLRIRRIK